MFLKTSLIFSFHDYFENSMIQFRYSCDEVDFFVAVGATDTLGARPCKHPPCRLIYSLNPDKRAARTPKKTVFPAKLKKKYTHTSRAGRLGLTKNTAR